MPIYNDIVVFTGEDISVIETVFQADGLTVQNITGWNIALKVTNDAGTLLITKVGSITSGIGGNVSFTLASADTLALSGRYHYRILRTDAGADTVLTAGTFVVITQ